MRYKRIADVFQRLDNPGTEAGNQVRNEPTHQLHNSLGIAGWAFPYMALYAAALGTGGHECLCKVWP